MVCYGEHRFGLDCFCTCTGNTAMTLSQLNKYSGPNADIYIWIVASWQTYCLFIILFMYLLLLCLT